MTFFRPVGNRFVDPERGEMLVIERDGCDCARIRRTSTPTIRVIHPSGSP